MYWDLRWRCPLLIDDNGRVLLQDNGPPGENVVYLIEEYPFRDVYIAEFENALKEHFHGS